MASTSKPEQGVQSDIQIVPNIRPDGQKQEPPFFRSTLFQILVVGVCAFCAPGIWSAMNGLGVGGSESPDLVNAANALLYALMTVTCFAGPWLTNIIGFRWTLALGSIGYPLYAAGLYLNNRTGATWLVYLGSVTCGISAGFFWSVEGAIATGYPEQHKRGRYIATWFTFRNFGNIIGGAVSLGINHNANHRGQVGWQTYSAFIAIQCLGLVFGFFLSNPEKVQRDDHTKLEAPRGIHWREEATAMWRLARSRSILLLVPLFWYFGWIQAYPGTYLETYFTVRARALGSFMSAVVGTIATWLGGSLVDLPWHKSRKARAVATFILIALLNSATWIWAVIIQDEYRRTKPVLDWSDHSAFGRGFGLYLFERISLGLVENYIYWCIGNLSDSPGDQIRYSSLLRGIETAGVAVGFGVQAVPTALIVTASINLALWFLALPFSYYATLQVVRKFQKLIRDHQGLEEESEE
ncbi:Major facilitator superfamily domain general substrate transporter [Penicillium atrosanguineum]|uniref:Major facilitator superfamily domain general substrate transporter n=1 Tax=Penicillium atrosanguineum TaxID=1132637 RepID=A0A9W9H2L4_9EURO|nr:FMN-binding split barrel-like protein [Penicillium atrosanguineum]KAJ5125710.1 Major facilitator superfamily domain general substrate transporter [Penicillium atrosanguineum]KAJ5136474.1 Major facilitator superfamily domain general substrate transporter [Penicillium atrosanguineum]KAJ5292804.1 FMN-binding split barrel-like protein [Penicillium atrosanguineum]KAJ5303156.1 Major facilitator superfamily domain general substrate transporter [Penicillium atrosanguineum]